MNAAVRAAILRTQSVSSHLKASFFHSTPVLERKRRTSWDSKSNVHRKRFRRMREKQELLRNVNAFASNMFTSWHDEFDYKEPPSSQKRTSWFKKQYAKEPKGKWNGKHGPRNFDFCEVDEDFDIDYIFPGGPRGFSFSFTYEDDEPPRWYRDQSSSRSSRSKHHRIYEDEDDDYTTSTESSDSESESEPNQASHRQALGLSPSGPLNLKDVKHAYRVCALKWHPDRHQGSTKEAAEAKFKLCSVAYQSLCEKLGKSNANKKNKRSKKFLREHQEKVRRAVEELKREREEAAAKKAKETKENMSKCNQDSKSTPRKSQFGYEDKDFDIIFRSLFGVPRGFDYSIYEEEDRRWWYHPSWFSGSSNNSWRSKYRFYDKDEEQEEEEELSEEEEEESNSSSNWWRSKSRFDEKKKEEEDGYGSSKSNGSVLSDPIEATHRETLGLSPWAPLKLEDVKHAYRTCALKWHPDLHDDSTKAEAEAKFKLCVVAYQSLIQKLQCNILFFYTNSWRSNFQFSTV
ncbi:unnamed protein product [Brassica napus]|uniref:(rape) hypothetical protein n=1 Tax=Brassica napus TaxID=3708 RepID=A0A817BAB2_BRANA|nr:unnamed protein product [Brassica napus]